MITSPCGPDDTCTSALLLTPAAAASAAARSRRRAAVRDRQGSRGRVGRAGLGSAWPAQRSKLGQHTAKPKQRGGPGMLTLQIPGRPRCLSPVRLALRHAHPPSPNHPHLTTLTHLPPQHPPAPNHPHSPWPTHPSSPTLVLLCCVHDTIQGLGLLLDKPLHHLTLFCAREARLGGWW